MTVSLHASSTSLTRSLSRDPSLRGRWCVPVSLSCFTNRHSFVGTRSWMMNEMLDGGGSIRLSGARGIGTRVSSVFQLPMSSSGSTRGSTTMPMHSQHLSTSLLPTEAWYTALPLAAGAPSVARGFRMGPCCASWRDSSAGSWYLDACECHAVFQIQQWKL